LIRADRAGICQTISEAKDMFGLGMQEMVIVMVVAVLLFGKRLPEVARSLGSSYHQFRKGLQDIQSEMNTATNSYSYSSSSPSRSSNYSTFDDEDYDEPTAPKFEAPPSVPAETEPIDGGAAIDGVSTDDSDSTGDRAAASADDAAPTAEGSELPQRQASSETT
jgi:sec-independent protein translocase protein TatA